MALIDELRSESEQRQNAVAQAEQEKAQRESAFLQRSLPRIQQAYDYLREMVEHLQVVQPDTGFAFFLPKCGEKLELVQCDYRIEAIPTQGPHKVRLDYTATGRRRCDYRVTPRSVAEDVEEILHKHAIPHAVQDYRDDLGHTIGKQFGVYPKIPARIAIELDSAREDIRVAITNHDTPGIRELHYPPEQIDTAFLEDLGNFILRRSSSLIQLDMPDELRSRLRKRIKKEQRAQRRRRLLRLLLPFAR